MQKEDYNLDYFLPLKDSAKRLFGQEHISIGQAAQQADTIEKRAFCVAAMTVALGLIRPGLLPNAEMIEKNKTRKLLWTMIKANFPPLKDQSEKLE